jgi:hypothetical protein
MEHTTDDLDVLTFYRDNVTRLSYGATPGLPFDGRSSEEAFMILFAAKTQAAARLALDDFGIEHGASLAARHKAAALEAERPDGPEGRLPPA